MGQVSTNWHLGDMGVPDDADPMAEITELQSLAKPIDLSTTDKDEAVAELSKLLDREGRYVTYSTGVEACDLKWAPDHLLMGGTGRACATCPAAIENWRENPQGLMCRLGREQERAVGKLMAIERAEQDAMAEALGLDAAWLANVEHVAAEADELAEAVLVAA